MRAVVSAWIDLDWMNKVVPSGDLPRGSVVVVMDRDGVILARTPNPDAWVGKSLAGETVFTRPRASGIEGTMRSVSLDGTVRLWAYVPIHVANRTAAYVAVGIPSDQAYAKLRHNITRSSVLLLLTSLLIAGVAWIVADALVLKRLHSLIFQARRLTDGDLSARTGRPSSTDELGHLERAFDEMARSLQANSDELRSTVQELRHLAHRLQTVREDERSLVASEVNEDIGQALAGLKLGLSDLRTRLLPQTDARCSEAVGQIDDLSHQIDSALQTVRRIATWLRPAILDTLGLVPALEWQARDFQIRSGLPCSFQCSFDELPLSSVCSTAVFRVFQEALSNVAAHARASQVTARFDLVGSRLRLTVQDDGDGMPPERLAATDSFGISSMRERATALGGNVEIQSALGEGTIVRLLLPGDSEPTTSSAFGLAATP
jgi:signal transduction histidine kinase